MLKFLFKLTFLFIFYLTTFNTFAQVSITVLDSTNAYIQDFNSLSPTTNAPWVNNSTLPNWYVESSKIAITNITASTGSTPAGSLYNFGNAGSSDRALGSINSKTTGHIFYGVRMKNNTSVTIRAFSISFTGEQWRHSKESAQKLEFSYKSSTAPITILNNGGWTDVHTLDFTSPIKGGKPTAMNGNLASNRRLKTYTITNINLAPGSEIMFRWEDADKAGDDHALGIDDVTIVPFNPTDFYSQPSGNLNELNNWGTLPDGTGIKPLNFTSPYQIFHIRNSATKTINHDWIIKGFGSKAIIDYSNNLNFTIPDNHLMKGEIDILEKGTLTINNQIPPTIGYIDINTTVVYGYDKGNQTIAPADYYNLNIAGGGDKLPTDAVTVNGTLAFTSGYFNAGNYDLIMGTGTTITGANATNYIKTTETGSLVREINHGATIAFPIGTATSYNPAVVKNDGEPDIFSASVSPKLYSSYDENYVANGGEILSKVVSRTWLITEESDSASSAIVTLQWNATEELPEFNRTLVNVSHFENNSWPTSANATATGVNPYTRTSTEVTKLGVFAVTGMSANLEQTPLPVELLYFQAKANNNQALLTWATASETNNAKFLIEKSANGLDWKIAGEVKGNGTTNAIHTYSFIDNAVINRQYYRLKQVDLDGTFAYSNIELVTFGRKTEEQVTLVANPAQEKIQFNVNGHDLTNATLDIFTTAGVLVKKQILTEPNTNNGIDISNLAPGVYIYRITNINKLLGTDRLVKTN